MNQHRERAQRKEREQARSMKERPARALRPGYGEDAFPDPPGNDEFDLFDASFQSVVEARFDRGVLLTRRINAHIADLAKEAGKAYGVKLQRRVAESRRVAQLHLDRLTSEQRDYRKSRSEVLDRARRHVRT